MLIILAEVVASATTVKAQQPRGSLQQGGRPLLSRTIVSLKTTTEKCGAATLICSRVGNPDQDPTSDLLKGSQILAASS